MKKPKKFAAMMVLCLIGTIHAFAQEVSQPPDTRLHYNKFYQLDRDDRKQEVACPKQTARTMVAVVFGQSNAANHGNKSFESVSPNIYNWFEGKCYRGEDPLLGGGGLTGGQWVAMSNLLIQRHDAIVLIPMAINGTPVKRWLGDLHEPFVGLLENTKRQFTVTDFLWHQGEADGHSLSTSEYRSAMKEVISTTRQYFPRSRFYVSVASICAPNAADPQIQAAQRALVNPSKRIYQGANTDLLGAAYRWDGCHLNGKGQEAAAVQWSKILR